MVHKNTCIVFLCDKAYFDKFNDTCNQLLFNGNYNGPICLVVGDDLYNDPLLDSPMIHDNNIIVKHFPDIIFTESMSKLQDTMHRPSHWSKKKFQFHKLHLFNTFFKQWDYIFYLDCGITIFDDISPILNELTEHRLLAHSDAYPVYERKLHTQFDSTQTQYFSRLNSTYNLNIDYFQTTILLYDTKIIEEDTYENLLNLLHEYPISITNDQGIIALYFTSIKPLFTQIKTHNEYTYFYDYLSRNQKNKYIMLKEYR